MFALIPLMLICISAQSAEEKLRQNDTEMRTAHTRLCHQIPARVEKDFAILISTLQQACSFPTVLAQVVVEMMGDFGYGSWFPHVTVYQPNQPWTYKSSLRVIPLRDGHFVATRLFHMDEGIILRNSDGEICKSYDERRGEFIAFTALPEMNLIALSAQRPKRVATLAADVWDYTTGKSVCCFYDDNRRYPEHTYIRSIVALPPHQLALCSLWNQRCIEIWDMHKKKCITRSKSLRAHLEYGLVLLSTGNFAVSYYHSSSKCFKVAIWKRAENKWIHTSSGHNHHISNMLALPEGLLATTSADNNAPRQHIFEDFMIKVWDAKNGTYLYNLTGHQNIISSLIMLPSNKLASGSRDGDIKIWDLKKRICTRTFNNEHPIFTLLLLPHGRLAAGSSGAINIWDLKARVVFQTLLHDGVKTLTMLSDGKLLSADFEGKITIWNSTLSSTAPSNDTSAIRSNERGCFTRLWKLCCSAQRMFSLTRIR